MKNKPLFRVLPLLLVLALMISAVPSVSAGAIRDPFPGFSGTCSASEDDLYQSVVYPDRQLDYYFVPYHGDFDYWFTYQYYQSSSNNYHETLDSLTTTGYIYSNSYYSGFYIYPYGTKYLDIRPMCDGIVDTEFYFQSCIPVYYSATLSSTSLSFSVYLTFYDDAFNTLSSTQFTSTSTVYSGTLKEFLVSSWLTCPSDAAYVKVYYWVYSKSSSVNVGVYLDGLGTYWRFYHPLSEQTVDGIWQFNDALSITTSVSHLVNFTSDGVEYNAMTCDTASSLSVLQYNYSGGSETVYVDQWYGDTKKTVDFGSDPQTVSPEFYAWLTANATRISDSASSDTSAGTVTIKDYSGSTEITDYEVSFPSTVYVTESGLEILPVGGDDADKTYFDFSGTGTFIGCSTVPNDSTTRYGIGRSFTVTKDTTIYLHCEGDVSSGDDDDDDSGGSSSGSTATSTGNITLYDYTGTTEIFEIDSVKFPCKVYVDDTGLQVTNYGSDVVTYTYVFDGTGTFAGVSPFANDNSIRYPIGRSFTMAGADSLYLILEDSISSGDDSGSSGSGSSGDDLDGSGLDNSSGQLDQGNDELGGVMDDLDDAQSSLPTVPDDVEDQIQHNLDNFYNSNLSDFMPWYGEGYEGFWDIILTPSLSTLAVSLLLYFIFGKAKAG